MSGEGYRWRQTANEITVIMPIPANVKGKGVVFKLKDQTLTLGYLTTVVVQGKLFGRVDVDDAIWDIDTVDGERCVQVTIAKKANMNDQPWAHLTQEEAEAKKDVDLTITHKVFLDVRVGAEESKPERIVIGLYGKAAPRTVENFRCLCTGEKGGKLHYKGTRFHKAVEGFLVEGGDVVHYDGSGGASIYGGIFDDETFAVKHSKKGIVGMANYSKPNNNASAFYITLGAKEHLDNRRVAIGEVLEGYEAVEMISFCGEGREMVQEAVVVDCGEL